MAGLDSASQGPLTEELLFRSAAVPLLLSARMSVRKVIFLSPVIFGLAHIHHFYEFRISHPRTPLIAAVARSVFQLAYTSLFGAYATFLFLRTGSLLAVVLVHSFCNSMGLPRIWGRTHPYWLDGHGDSGHQPSIVYTFFYYSLLVGGLFTWRYSLFSLTGKNAMLMGIDI